jgi:hypothetical protein
MMTIVGPLIDLAVAVLGMIATDEAMKYITQLNDARTALQAELAKGYDSDDAKVEALYAQIQVLTQTVNNQLTLYQNKGAGGSATVTATIPTGGV